MQWRVELEAVGDEKLDATVSPRAARREERGERGRRLVGALEASDGTGMS